MSDEIRKGRQAHEDTLMAMAEAGMFPGFHHRPLTSMEDAERIYAEAAKLGERGVYVVRVPRSVAEQGLAGGAAVGLFISGFPEDGAKVTLAFDGWADDPRELFEVPEVVDFCNGLVYGPTPMENPDPKHPAFARAVLPRMLDEHALSQTMGRSAWDQTGRYWVIAVAHASMVFFRDPNQGSGFMRDAGLCLSLYDVFMGRIG